MKKSTNITLRKYKDTYNLLVQSQLILYNIYIYI